MIDSRSRRRGVFPSPSRSIILPSPGRCVDMHVKLVLGMRKLCILRMSKMEVINGEIENRLIFMGRLDLQEGCQFHFHNAW